MFAEPSTKTQDLLTRMNAFFDEHIYPNEATYHAELEELRRQGNPWQTLTLIDALKVKARAAGLWNLFLPHAYKGQGGISNLDYAPLCELMGRVMWSGEVFNCSAPDTGNMETFERYGTASQKEQWLEPLLDGQIRSAFLMTEPAVASSDATNIQCSIRREGDEYVINGRKWYSSGAGSPRCKIFIVMGKTDPDAARHAQQSMVLVPRDTPGVSVLRPLSVFAYDDAPHGHMEVLLENVRVPVGNILLGEGRGFEIAQGRLGPGDVPSPVKEPEAASRRPVRPVVLQRPGEIPGVPEAKVAPGLRRRVAHGQGHAGQDALARRRRARRQGDPLGPQDVDVDHHGVDLRQGQGDLNDGGIKAVHAQSLEEPPPPESL